MSEEITQLLEKSYKEKNNELRRAAEDQLKEAAKAKPGDMLKFTLQLAVNQDAPIDLRTSAAIFSRKVVEYQDAATVDELKAEMELVIEALMCPSLTGALNEHLMNTLTQIMAESKAPDLPNFLHEKFCALIASDDQKSTIAGLLVLKTLFSSKRHKSKFGLVYKAVESSFLQLGKQLSTTLQSEVVGLSEMLAQSPDYDLNTANPNFLLRLEVMQYWMETVYKICVVLEEQLAYLTSNQDIWTIFYEVMGLNVSIGPEKTGLIICQTGSAKFDEMTNNMKKFTFKAFRRFIQYIITWKANITQSIAPYILPPVLLAYTGLTMHLMQNATKLDVIFEDETIEQLTVEQITLLSSCAKLAEFREFFLAVRAQLFYFVILPLLKTRQSEREQLEDEPQEFCSLAVDTADKQNSQTAKTSAAKMLVRLAEHLEGTVTLVASVAIALIVYSVESNDPNAIETNYPPLLEIKGTPFFPTSDRAQKLEVSFMLLSILNDQIGLRVDLVEQLEAMLLHHNEVLFSNELDPLVRCRMALFVGFCYISIFKKQDQKEISIKLLEYLVAMIRNDNQAAIRFQAIESLQIIFNMADNLPEIQNRVQEILALLAPLITSIEFPSFFDLIYPILDHFADILKAHGEIVCDVTRLLVTRANQEEDTYHENSNDKNIIIQKCWGSINEIAKNFRYQPVLTSGFEQALEPAFLRVINAPGVHYEENLLKCVVNYIKTGKTISGQTATMLTEYLPIVWSRSNGSDYLSFKLLMLHFNYSQLFFTEKPQQLHQLLDMVFQLAFGNPTLKHWNRGCAFLLLQICIQKYAAIIPEPVLTSIFNTCLQTLQNPGELPKFARLKVIQVLLSGILAVPAFAAEFLTQNDVLLNIPNVMSQYTCTSSYDRKLLVLSYSQILDLIHEKDITTNVLSTFIAQIIDNEAVTLTEEKNTREMLSRMGGQKDETNVGATTRAEVSGRDDPEDYDEDDDEDEYDEDSEDDNTFDENMDDSEGSEGEGEGHGEGEGEGVGGGEENKEQTAEMQEANQKKLERNKQLRDSFARLWSDPTSTNDDDVANDIIMKDFTFPLMTIDELVVFRNCFTKLKSARKEIVTELMQCLPNDKILACQEILATERLDGNARKLLKVKKKQR